MYRYKELEDMMDKHLKINWSEVARQSFREKLTEFVFSEVFRSKHKLRDGEALEHRKS